jgi:multidrug efflux pump subunit AcrA (membrane-fusion protein)
MRIWKTIMITFLLGVVGISSFGCGSESESELVPEMQVLTVQRGDLIIDITAVGNLALSRTDDLAFEIAGTVEEVLVEEGDTVEEGQLLAKLDTSEWEDSLAVLEDKVTAAERSLSAAERQLTVKERALTTAEHQLEVKKRNVMVEELDVLQAEINLKNAEIALEQTEVTYDLSDFKVAQAAVTVAERNLEEALEQLLVYPGYEGYQNAVVQAQTRLNTVQATLDAMLSGFDTEEVAIKKLQVDITRGKLEEAQEAVNDAQVAVEEARKDIEDAQVAVEDAQVAVEDARKDVEDAQEALDEARSKSTVITAPFDGFITTVNVEGGDEVLKGTVAVQLADPAKFEADVMVSEMDIFQVKLGGDASVQLDAMLTVVLPAKVTHISPTATIQSGVVNYKVKVEIQSLETVQQERQAARPGMMEGISSGQLPERLQQAVEEGRMTREQAEALMKGWQQAAEDISSGQLPEFLQQAIEEGRITQEQAEAMVSQWQQGQEGQAGEQQRQTPAMLNEDFQLREGLTVTVSILVVERNDVLLVPNGLLIHRGSETLVQVLKSDVVEERTIKTGLSDWQYTEVTEGLSEGEEVVVPQATTPSETPAQGRPGGMFR